MTTTLTLTLKLTLTPTPTPTRYFAEAYLSPAVPRLPYHVTWLSPLPGISRRPITSSTSPRPARGPTAPPSRRQVSTPVSTSVSTRHYYSQSYSHVGSLVTHPPQLSHPPQGVSVPPYDSWAPAALKDSYAPKLTDAFWKQHAPAKGCSVVNSPNEPIEMK